MASYVDIVLPLAQPLYTFSLKDGMEAVPGDAVTVQFGRTSTYTGIVWRVHNNRPEGARIKEIVSKPYSRPLLSAEQMRLWDWIADYYMCTLGEVMRMAVPSVFHPRATKADGSDVFKPKSRQFAVLESEANDEDVRERLKRLAPKRYELILEIESFGGEMPKDELKATPAVIHSAIKAGIVRIEERIDESSRFKTDFRLPELSKAQRLAFESLENGFAKTATALLHGVTSSGKTEIYTHFIAKVLAQGGDVLYLVPEIAISTQILTRLQNVFGERVRLYHSGLTSSRRTSVYVEMMNSSGGHLIVGARSAIFLPYSNLGLVIIDEENDSSYKQTEPNPRYNGRDTALFLASLHKAKTILGSATPSVESLANVLSGKYFKVYLGERYGGGQLPKIIVSDTIWAVKRGERHAQFNKELEDRIRDRLDGGEQVILFQNRRGFAPYVECGDCGWTPRCPHCNVTLTRHAGTMRCHYCNYREPVPNVCPHCGQENIKSMGFGTERVEEQLAHLFPKARILRLDGDTSRSESSYNRIISQFQRGEADILIGTQIVTKGLDFANVTLIGILNADNLLNAADFRAGERALQLLTQVAGRSGRRTKRGEVVIQTSDPSHPILRRMGTTAYEDIVNTILAERHQYSYPPYVKLVKVILRSRNAEQLKNLSVSYSNELKAKFGSRVIGPVQPLVDKIREQYILHVIIKIENTSSFSRFRSILRDITANFRKNNTTYGLDVIFDVDPTAV